jgi:hypothetical protein
VASWHAEGKRVSHFSPASTSVIRCRAAKEPSMTFLALIAAIVAIRFSLDDYTNWYNSPNAALLFWSCFVAVVLVIIALMFWMFRRVRPH